MRIAIPVFQNRVSPTFDWSTRMLIVRIEDDCEIHRGETDLPARSFTARLHRLTDFAIDILICGGISSPLITLIESRGIEVVPCIAGGIDEVIQGFIEGRIPGDGFFIPGCRKQARKPHSQKARP